MRTLFIKIFLWFWLAMAVVWAVFLIPVERQQREEMASYWRSLTNQRLELSGRAVLHTLRRYGPERMDELIGSLAPSEAAFPYLFDEELEELTGRQPEAALRDAARRALTEGDLRERHEDVGYVVTHSFEQSGRRHRDEPPRRYVAVQAFPTPGFVERSFGARVLRWLAVLASSGLVCWGLAYYLTRPVARLREATHRLAAGELQARVGPQGRREDELVALGRDFDRMAERIEDLLTTQRQLLTDISHELRSPLARLYVALGLARRRSGEAPEPALERIEREAERLNELIGELLALSRMEAGDTGPASTVELNRLVEEVAADADYEARHRDRRVEVLRLDRQTVKGHEELLRRAVENVLRNAVRHTAEGTAVEVRLTVEDQEALLSIRDHGPGVPEEDLGKLFRPFFRTDQARQREAGGAGIGLAIARRAVRLHGGDIVAANVEGGLEVQFRIPTGDVVGPHEGEPPGQDR